MCTHTPVSYTHLDVYKRQMVGTVAAGQPILAQEHIEGYFPIPAEYMPNTDCFMLKVKGESLSLIQI